MNLTDSYLPWRDHPVVATGNIQPWFASRLSRDFASYLPAFMFVYADQDVAPPAIDTFLDEMASYLEDEIQRRIARKARFVARGLFSDAELTRVLTGSTSCQPWVLYYSKDGGVGPIDVAATPERVVRGYKPCSSMTNHGLAWQRDADKYATWLVTSRKPGQAWDWDSDIGHESAHAAFAPVPLFTQLVESNSVPIAELTGSATNLTGAQLGRLGYPFSELAVVAVRGEPRPTDTHLPVLETPETLIGLLEVAIDLVPRAGFEAALRSAERVGGIVDVNDGDEIFEIAAPILRIMPELARCAASPVPPTVEWYGSLGASYASPA